MGRFTTEINLNPSAITDFVFIATAGQTSITLPTPGVPIIFVNGAIQRDTTDYTVSDLEVTFTTALNLNDQVLGYVLQRGKNTETAVAFNIETFSGDNSTTAFVSQYSIPSGSSLLISISGVLQHFPSAYTTSGNTISFTEAPGLGSDNIQVIHIGTVLEANVPADNSVDFGAFTTDLQNAVHRKNHIINGNFDIWQRATTQTTDGINSVDRWKNGHVGSTKVVTQEAFTLGQTEIPNNPKYYIRTVVTSVPATGNHVNLNVKLEDVTKLAGKTITLSFWAKADATKNIATEFQQNFGSGGSPSTNVTGLSVSTHALTTSWQKITTTVTLPSVSGKTLGTDNNDNLVMRWWFDAGSSWDLRSNSLGQQSGTFDIAQVQLEKSPFATQFEVRPLATEIELCQRYFEKSYNLTDDPGFIGNSGSHRARKTSGAGATTVSNIYIDFKVTKRTIPTVTVYSPTTGASGNIRNDTTLADVTATATASYIGENNFSIHTIAGITNADLLLSHFAADAEL